jgi:hypothetical protein
MASEIWPRKFEHKQWLVTLSLVLRSATSRKLLTNVDGCQARRCDRADMDVWENNSL